MPVLKWSLIHFIKECEEISNMTNEGKGERCFRTGDDIIEFNGYQKVNWNYLLLKIKVKIVIKTILI